MFTVNALENLNSLVVSKRFQDELGDYNQTFLAFLD